MALDDRVQPLKLEDPATGGDSVDAFPTALNKNEDYVDCRGITHQNDTSNDSAVRTERDSSDNLVLVDPNAGSHTLSALLGGGFDINDVVWDNAGGIVFDNADEAITKVA